MALEPTVDYQAIAALVSRDELDHGVKRLSSYQSRVTGYPDTGLLVTRKADDRIRELHAYCTATRRAIREVVDELWLGAPAETQKEATPKEVQERRHQLPLVRKVAEDAGERIEQFAVEYDRPPAPAAAPDERVADGAIHETVRAIRGAVAELSAAIAGVEKQADAADLDEKREALKAVRFALKHLEDNVAMRAPNVDNLAAYVPAFKALSLADLEALEAEGKLGAAGYVYLRFQQLGLSDVDIETFSVVVPMPEGATSNEEMDAELTAQPGGAKFTVYPLWPNLVRTCKTPPGGISGRLIYAGQSTLRDYNGQDVVDAVVLLDLNCGTQWFNAPLLGARAVLFIEPEDTLRGEVESKFLSIPVDIPRFWVPKEAADHLLALLKSAETASVNVKCDTAWETRPAYNIIGRIGGSDPRLKRQQVVIQSYYDSISVTPSHAPGAESAANCTGLLETIKVFVRHPPKRTVLFLATGGHFQGLAGAKSFIAKRKRGARTDTHVRELFRLAYASQKELSEAADRVWEEQKKKEKEKTEEEIAEERVKALRRIAKSLKAVRKNLKWFRKNVAEGLEANPNEDRPEEKLYGEEELAERERLLKEVFQPRAPVIEEAIDNLEATLERARPLEEEHVSLEDRQAMLAEALAAVEGLGDALDFSEEGISLWFSIDLSSHNDTFGIFYKCYFYDYAENIQWKFSDVGKKAREYAALIGDALAVDPGQALVDGINAIQGKTWRVYMGGKLALDSEVATLAAVPGLGFATIDDQRYLVDTPLDIAERVEIDNVHRQLQFLTCLLAELVSIEKPKDLYRIELDDNFVEVYGELVEFDPKRSYFPDEPVPEAIAVARAQSKTAMGVRCELLDQVGDDGKLSLLGLPNTRARGGQQRIEGYKIDPLDGHVSYAPDRGQAGEETYPIEIPLDMMEKPVTVVLFECIGMTIFDMVDQRFFQLLSQIYVYDAATEAFPQEYGYVLPLPPQQWVSYYEPVAVIYARAGTRLKVTMGASVLGLRFVLLNSRDVNSKIADPPAGQSAAQWRTPHSPSCREAAEGEGYLIDAYPSVYATPYLAARDMWMVDDHRAGVLEDHGIENDRIKIEHARAREALQKAEEYLRVKRYDKFFVNARAAWSYESRAYPDARKTETDVVKGVIFYLALLLPFAFFAERLLVAARDIRWQILWSLGIFLGLFILLGTVHPAFAITFTPIIILLAFIILALTLIVVVIIVGKFEEQMKQVKYEQTGIHTADVGRLSASAAAFSLGISNMRRRKTRTLLTCATLILLTFTVLSFTSVVPKVRANRIELPKEAPYDGILVRDKTWNPLGEPTTRIIANEFGDAHPVAPRAWYFSAMVGQQSFLNVYRGIEKVYAATAMVGLSPEEAKVTRPQEKLQWGRWFEPADRDVCVLPKGMADKLDIGKDDVGKVTVSAFGVPLRVIGVLNPSKFKKLVDLDGEQLTPVDYLLMQQREQRQASETRMSEDELREYIHLAPDQVLVVPFAFAINVGATLRSVAIAFDAPEQVDENLTRLMRRVELNLYAGRGGKTYLCSAVGATGFSGLRELAVPIIIAALIVLNTMLGSVYERTKEIGIYSSLGLAPIHIASLFVAEACVYAILGAISGYLVGQVTSKILVSADLLAGLNLNYSSLSAVGTTLIVMVTVMLSTIYPARRASQMAVPGVERRWKLPDPVDDALHMDLPFTVTGDQALGVNMYLQEYLEAHADYSLGHFSTADIQLSEYEAERGSGYKLSLMVWLAPYDLGVSERLTILTRPSEDEEVFEIACVIERESGDESSWIRVTRNFVNMLRKQYLLWRTFKAELKAEYGRRGREQLTRGPAPE